MLSNSGETEARPQHSEILRLESNCMSNHRFSFPSLSVEPKYVQCSSVHVVDPVDDFIEDLNSRSI